MGKREKLIIGIILIIGTIAALHLLLFKPMSDEVAKKQAEFKQTKDRISQIAVKPSDAGKVREFKSQIESMITTYDEVSKSLVFNKSQDSIKLTTKNKWLVTEEMPIFLDKVAELEALQNNADEMEINLLEKLNISRNPKVSEDKIYVNLNDLESKMTLLKDANLNNDLKGKLEEEKGKLRKALGFDDAELEKMGKRKRMMYEYTTLDFLDNKLRETGEIIPLHELVKRLEVKPLDEADFKLLIEQLNIISDVTKLAIDTKMDAIFNVDIFKSEFLPRDSYVRKQKQAAEEARKAAEAAAKTNPMGGGMNPMMMGMAGDPAMGMMPMDGARGPAPGMMAPGMMGGRMNAETMKAANEVRMGTKKINDFPAEERPLIQNAIMMMSMGGRMGGIAAVPTGPDPNAPIPPEERLALNLPITISVKGNSRSFINFLYKVSFAPRIHEIDKFDLKVDNEGLVELNFRINTYTNINGVNWNPKAEEENKPS